MFWDELGIVVFYVNRSEKSGIGIWTINCKIQWEPRFSSARQPKKLRQNRIEITQKPRLKLVCNWVYLRMQTGGNGDILAQLSQLQHGLMTIQRCEHCQITFPDPILYIAHAEMHKKNSIHVRTPARTLLTFRPTTNPPRSNVFCVLGVPMC